MTFTIVFFGLIAHIVIGVGDGRRAVLINPDDVVHDATMTVQCADILPLESTMQCGPGEKSHTFSIGGGRHFRLEATGVSGDPTINPSFDALVPHLKKLIDPSAANLTANAKFGRIQKRVSTYLDYQGTSASLVATNKGPYGLEKVEFDYPQKATQCVATSTAYVLANAPSLVVIQDVDGTDKLTLKGSASITISNTPHDMNFDDHFVDYNWITQSTKIAHLKVIDQSCMPMAPELTFDSIPGSAMKHATPVDHSHLSLLFVTAECTNSQFP
jgi:hypothetical protein